MKPARRKRWLFPFFLLSLAAVDPAFPATLCEGIRDAESTVRKLEGDRSRLESEKAALTTRVDEERARAATQRDRQATDGSGDPTDTASTSGRPVYAR